MTNLSTTVPDVHGKPVIKSCMNCQHLEDDSDGPEYCDYAYWICNKKPHMGNLKQFPFSTPQKCFELSFVHEVDWEAEARKL